MSLASSYMLSIGYEPPVEERSLMESSEEERLSTDIWEDEWAG